MNNKVITILVLLACVYFLFIRKKDDYAAHSYNHNHSKNKDDTVQYSYKTEDGSNKIVSKQTHYPSSLTELVKIIKSSQGHKIRVSGGHHTFNDISITPDITVRTEGLRKIINLDKNKKQVTVESGITLMELNSYLEKHNLSLPIFPAIPWQTIAGAISTSTHGSTSKFGSFSSMVVDMTLVLANGDVKKFDRSSPDFNAVATGLGCLGAIYSITIQCEDLYAVKQSRIKIPFSQFMKRYKTLQNRYQYLQAYLWPFTEDLDCSVYLREKKSIDYMNRNKSDEMLDNKFKKLDIGHKVLTKNREGTDYTEMEIAVSEEHLEKAVKEIVRIYKQYKKSDNYDTPYSVLIRFTQPDTRSLLSMAVGRKSVFLNVFNNKELHDDKVLNTVFKEIQDTLITKFKGRPHYGKRHYLNRSRMINVYGKERVNTFNAIRKRLDPNGMFSNSYINRLFE